MMLLNIDPYADEFLVVSESFPLFHPLPLLFRMKAYVPPPFFSVLTPAWMKETGGGLFFFFFSADWTFGWPGRLCTLRVPSSLSRPDQNFSGFL